MMGWMRCDLRVMGEVGETGASGLLVQTAVKA